MVIKKAIFKESTETSCDFFDKKFNLLTSKNTNSTGKSTFCRLLFYAFGYQVPSTEGINFNKIESTLYVENNKKNYIIKRKSTNLNVSLVDESWQYNYILPDEHIAFISHVFNIENHRISLNLLGLMYIDQEKGWTLFNRGKVIGSIRFSIDELIASLQNIDCEDLFSKREILEREIDKYQSLLNMNSIKEEYYENNNNLEIITLGDDLKRKVASLQLSIQSIKEKIDDINRVIRQDKSFFEYIEKMNLYVKTPDNQSIKVTKENIENSCNIEYLKAEKHILSNQLLRLENEKSKLLHDYNAVLDGPDLFGENITIQIEKHINSALSNINVDVASLKTLLLKAKDEKGSIKEQIKMRIRQNNEYITKIYNLFFKYAKMLGVEKNISNKTDYIFTDNLKGKTGALFQKLIIAYKVAAIKVVEEAIGSKLILIIDSPKSKELDDKNTELIMNFLKNELSENQVFIASIFSEEELFINFDKMITFNNKAIENRNI